MIPNPTGKGGFKKGQSGNPKGRPKKEREERYRAILLNTVTFDDWRDIVAKAKDQAKRGDAVARKWLADYLVGAPLQNVDVTSGGEPLCIVVRGPQNESQTDNL